MVKDSTSLHQQDLESIIDHLMKISLFSNSSVHEFSKTFTHGHAAFPSSNKLANFPLVILPFSRERHFHGRQREIDKIYQGLKSEGKMPLRNFSMYGHRGIGKTEIALEYAHRHPTGFDAIF
jgi:hypothetical protein